MSVVRNPYAPRVSLPSPDVSLLGIANQARNTIEWPSTTSSNGGLSVSCFIAVIIISALHY